MSRVQALFNSQGCPVVIFVSFYEVKKNELRVLCCTTVDLLGTSTTDRPVVGDNVVLLRQRHIAACRSIAKPGLIHVCFGTLIRCWK